MIDFSIKEFLTDINLSEKDNFVRLLTQGFKEHYPNFYPIITNDIVVKSLSVVENSSMDNLENKFLNERTTYGSFRNFSGSIGDIGDALDPEETGYEVNTKVVLGGDHYNDFTINYYRLNIAVIIKAAQEITCTLNIYPVKGKDQEYYIDRICKQANILRESFNFEVRTHNKEGNTNIKEIVITAKPDSLLYRGTAVVKIESGFKIFPMETREPSVNSRLIPNIRTLGTSFNVLNQFNLSLPYLYYSKHNILEYLLKLYNNTENKYLVDPIAEVHEFKKYKYSNSYTNKFFPRGITHYTQYIAISNTDNGNIPNTFLSEGCFDDHIRRFNRYHGGCYTNGQMIRELSTSELKNAYNFLGNIIAFGHSVRYVDGGAFTACNPKVLIVHPNVNFAPSVRDFFFNNRVKTIYYSKKSRPFLLYLQFNSTNSGWNPSQEDQLATNWFTSKGVTLKKIDLDKVS